MNHKKQFYNHKLTNLAHTFLLFAGMLLILALLGSIVAGGQGVFWAVLIGLFFLLFGRELSPQFVLRMYKARPLADYEAPQLYQLVRELARRAKLNHAPKLYYVPSQMLNAFTVGSKDEAVIGVTDGLLRRLNQRELSGVLAHEVSHIRHNDMRVMGFASMIGRITGLFSTVGKLFLLLNLPLLLMGVTVIPWLAIFALLLAPLLNQLLILALSRTREYHADMGAAQLTGDPAGLASALRKFEYYAGFSLMRVLFPNYRMPDSTLLSTHPNIQERIKRLLSIAPSNTPPIVLNQPVNPLIYNTRRPTAHRIPLQRLFNLASRL